jgi:hypothetical protein
MKHIVKLFLLSLTLIYCYGCSTKFVAKDVTHSEVWDASINVIQSHHFIQTSKKSYLGIPTFERKIDPKKGIINVAIAYPPFGDRITKLRIYSQSDLEHLITIRVIQHSMFYIGPSRDQNFEERLRDQIIKSLYQKSQLHDYD